MGNPGHNGGCLDLSMRDARGTLDWRAPSDEPFGRPANHARPLGQHRHGWRRHEALAPWGTSPGFAAQSDLTVESARIRAAASRGTSR